MKNIAKKKLANILFQIMITLLILSGATVLSLVINNIGFSETNIVVVFILSVLIISNFTKGYVYGILASIIGMFSFNFFFTEPLHTFNVNNKNYIITFLVMLTASVFTSALTSKLIRSSTIANNSEKQSKMLYQITSSLAKTSGVSDVAIVSIQCLSNLLECDVSCITINEEYSINKEYSIKKAERGVTVLVLSEEQIRTSIQNKYTLPIADTKNQFGYICLPKNLDSENSQESKLLPSISTQIIIAMEREYLANEKEAAKNEAKREKYKSNLLRSISHDIRTPLAGIAGAAEVLLNNLRDEDNLRLVQGIYEDSVWLNQMVENILNLTKIQEGTLLVNKQIVAVEEIVGAAVKHALKFAEKHRILVEIPTEVVFVPMDGKLMTQVFINLIENAFKYSNCEDEIIIGATVDYNSVWFSVSDHGIGIKPENLPKVFDLFFVAEEYHADSRRGNGLGLTICKAIVNAHGGKIFVENNISGGATIRFSLPLEGGKKLGKQ
ncbi:MAG: DUF4118 domain-containing protein [Clostridia bacterium]